MVLPIIFGAASAFSSGLTAFGNYQSQAAQTRAANQAAMRDYRNRQRLQSRQYARDLTIFGRQQQQYNQQLINNNRAAQFAYQTEQRKLNDQAMQAAFQSQAELIQMMQLSGRAAASGQSGRTAARQQLAIQGAYGRNQAITNQARASAYEAYDYNTMRLRDRLNDANEAAYNDVAITPDAPLPIPVPQQRQGPSQFSLYSGLFGAALDGVSAYGQAKQSKLFG